MSVRTPSKGLLKKVVSKLNSTGSTKRSAVSTKKENNELNQGPRRLSQAADGTWYWECADGESGISTGNTFINFEPNEAKGERFNGPAIKSDGQLVPTLRSRKAPIRSVSGHERQSRYNHTRKTRGGPPVDTDPAPFARLSTPLRGPEPPPRKNTLTWDYAEVAPESSKPAWDCRDMPRMQILWYIKMVCASAEIGSFVVRRKQDNKDFALTVKSTNAGDLMTFVIEETDQHFCRIKGCKNAREFPTVEELIEYYAERKRNSIGIKLTLPTKAWEAETRRRRSSVNFDGMGNEPQGKRRKSVANVPRAISEEVEERVLGLASLQTDLETGADEDLPPLPPSTGSKLRGMASLGDALDEDSGLYDNMDSFGGVVESASMPDYISSVELNRKVRVRQTEF